MTERVVRYVDLTSSQGDELLIGTNVESGRVVDPMRFDRPEWLAITHVVGHKIGERYLLYFLFIDGRCIDFSQQRTLDEAIDQVGSVVQRHEWRLCSVELEGDAPGIPRRLLPR